ncbi:reverse transcriptase domain-containing protein [Tanacetum coccineum]
MDNESRRSLSKNERTSRSTTNGSKQQTHKQILTRLEMSGRIAKWAIKLGEHEIEFRGRNSVKGQILADFLAETPSMGYREIMDEEAKRKELEPENAGKLFMDGASSFDGSGAGLILLVANQVKGLFEARQPIIKQYLEKAKELLASFPRYSIEHIKRYQNKKLASMIFSKLAKEVLVEVVQDKSITQREVTDVTKEEGDSWMLPIREYLQLGKLPNDHKRQESYE